MTKLEAKFSAKLWTLRCLKKSGMERARILDLYNSIIRPVIEYCSNAYHCLLTKNQSDRLEKLQSRALKSIFGWNLKYEDLLEQTGQETLETRRKRSFDSFTMRAAKNPKYRDWFPLLPGTGHNTRKLEGFARTERLKNSPVYTMRRRLNEINREAK